MTTTVVYADAADGYLESLDGTYSTARAGAGLSANTTGTLIVGQEESGGIYGVYESFVNFDTSAITDSDMITAALLELGLSADQSTTDFTCQARTRDWGATLTTADFVAGASLGALTLLATRATSGIGATGSLKAFTENGSNLRDAINKTGLTSMILCSDRHVAGNTPSGATQEMVRWYSANEAGTSLDPTLTVTHSVPVIAGSQASETDTARAGVIGFGRLGSQATEVDTANAGARDIRILGSRATETASALAGAPNGDGTPLRRPGIPPYHARFRHPGYTQGRLAARSQPTQGRLDG